MWIEQEQESDPRECTTGMKRKQLDNIFKRYSTDSYYQDNRVHNDKAGQGHTEVETWGAKGNLAMLALG